MNILFIHGNFPGQFTNIAPEMASRLHANVAFLTLAENQQNINLPGVTNIRFSLHRSSGQETHHYLQPFEEAILKGQAVVRAIYGLSSKGFQPDLIVCHGGNGFGLYIKAILPHVKIISYNEWYFTRQNSEYLFQDLDVDNILRLETRNAPILQELVQADRAVSPTAWQASQFPPAFKDQIHTIFDGVNLDFFKPALPKEELSLKTELQEQPLIFGKDQLLLSYGTRGMEALRGFPEFMRAAAAAQQVFPQLQVIVFGRDRNAYSFEHKDFGGSWKEAMLNELSEILDMQRIHFTGLLNYGDLVRLFQRSDLHCYFTRPYVVSWGVFQASACGANLLVNDFNGMPEVFENGVPSLRPVDLDDQESINTSVISALQARLVDRDQFFCEAPKSSLPLELSLNICIEKWENLIHELMI